MDVALVDVAGVLLVLVYVMRNPGVVRAISLGAWAAEGTSAAN